jgi:two-component system, NtrC family, nitrogen regulation sensor histidine kinase GlnL
MDYVAEVPESSHLIASLPLPVFLVGPDNIISFANDASEGFLGQSKRRVEGAAVASILRFNNDRMNRALEAGEGDLSAQDMDVHTKSGLSNVDISITTMPRNPDWRLVVVTPRHNSRAHIGEQKDAGKQQALGAPAILGHEIKNPLAGIKGAAQLLARRVDPKDQPLTDLIVNEVDRIARLLDHMQDLGQSKLGQFAPANIHALIERAIRSIRAANRMMPSIAINYDPSLPEVMINDDAMVQILINLLQNAIDAIENIDEAVIGISTRFVMSGALREAIGSKDTHRTIKLPVEIVISDNGPGVPVHIEDELFAPFVTTKRDGQGLGLAIVKKLILQMNSRIVYERDTAKKTTNFKLFLPVITKET